jgi:hypothetical protein
MNDLSTHRVIDHRHSCKVHSLEIQMFAIEPPYQNAFLTSWSIIVISTKLHVLVTSQRSHYTSPQVKRQGQTVGSFLETDCWLVNNCQPGGGPDTVANPIHIAPISKMAKTTMRIKVVVLHPFFFSGSGGWPP